MAGTSSVDGGSSTSNSHNSHSSSTSEFNSSSEALNSSSTTEESLSNQTTQLSQLSEENTSTENLSQSQTTAESLTETKPSSIETVAGTIVDITSNTAAANVGFNAPLTGVNIFGQQIVDPSMQFGRYAPNSLSPSAGYNITQFSRTDNFFASYMARQTMVSSQASYEYAKGIDPSFSNTTFEVGHANGRSYDIQISDDLVEVKAGKSINSGQLSADIDLAKTGQTVDYVFAGNPITGNHGPDTKVAARLADATQATGGNLVSRVADVTPSASQLDTVVNASRFSAAARGAGKVLGPAGVALDVATISHAVYKDGGTWGQHTTVAVSETAGGWAGAASLGYAGAKGGAIVGAMVGGPAGAAIGAVVGGVGGAITGAIGGSWLGNKISSWF